MRWLVAQALLCGAVLIINGCTGGCNHDKGMQIPLYTNSDDFELAVEEQMLVGSHIEHVEKQMQLCGFTCIYASAPIKTVEGSRLEPRETPKVKFLRCGESRRRLIGNRMWVVFFYYDSNDIVTNVSAYTTLNIFL